MDENKEINEKKTWGDGMKKIAFVLPVPNMKIIGGYKVVYEYANYICEQGYDVSLIYNSHDGKNSKKIPRCIVYLIRFIVGKFGPKWFPIDRRIHKKVYKNYEQEIFREYDVVIATATETAEYVNKANTKKIYFVQGFENWGRSAEAVYETYGYDMEIITISKWLHKIISNYSKREVHYIPNGINRRIFAEQIAFERRKKYSIAMLYHDDDRKGCDLGIKILNRLKEKYAELEAYLFGFPKRCEKWPEWIHYYHNASPQEVSECINQARVFLCTSRQEGFGLTGLESIFCGCVLVTTDCYGIREYATEKNSFLCMIDAEEQIFDCVCEAFDNEKVCKEKKATCNELIEKFDEIEAKKRFLEVVDLVIDDKD